MLTVKAVSSIEETVTTPEILECLTLIPTSIFSFAALNVIDVLLLTFPEIVEEVLSLTCKGGCQLINKSALPLAEPSVEVSTVDGDTEATKDSTAGTISVLKGSFWLKGTISVVYPLSINSNFASLYSAAAILIWFFSFSSVLIIIYSFGEISVSSSPVAIVVEVKDQITSASGVSEKAELTVTDVLVKLYTALLSTLTDSDQYNWTKFPESSFTFADFCWVSIEAPSSSKRTKSPRTYAVEFIVAFSCCK